MRIAKILLIIAMTFTMFTLANGAQMEELPDGAGAFYFVDESNITLLEEKVVYNLDVDELADVEVNYLLRGGDNSEDINLYFVLPRIEEYSVSIDGVDITGSVARGDLPEIQNWEPNGIDSYIDQYSPNSNELYGLSIPMHFNAMEEKELIVEYKGYGGYNNSHYYVNTVYSHIYYLTPAKFWNENAEVELIVNMQKDKNTNINSNLELNEISEYQYQYISEDIPDTEWALEIYSTDGLYFGTNDASMHNIGLWIIFGAITAISILLQWRLRKDYILPTGYIIANVVLFGFMSEVGYYINDYLIKIFFALVLWGVVPLVYSMAKKKGFRGF